jgi:alkanesulfonate monooxygenase SsuD/methylene tetrahydromethanopterin reductase-like flavin-dependent oxidoreductase (luciferase family)
MTAEEPALRHASYGIPPEESRARFDEELDFILAAWTNDSFSFDGKYFQARELTVVP